MSAPASTLTAWVVLPDGALAGAESVELALDETWAPYVQATAVIPDAVGRAALLDPRGGAPRVSVGLRRSWAGRPVAQEMSAEWAGLTAAALTAEWVGMTAAALTAGWLVDWGSGDRPSDELRADLAVRGRRVSYKAGTITLRAASDELIAQGQRVALARASEDLRTRVLALLRAAGLPAEQYDLAAGDVYGMRPTLSLAMSKSVWDEATAQTSPLRLWCDETRTWRLTDPTAAPTSTLHVTRVEDGEDDVNLDGEWADVYAVTCHWPSADGTAQLVQTRVWPDPLPAGTHRVVHEDITLTTRGDAWPGPTDAEMAARLNRLQSTGRAQTFTAPLDPTARPGMAITTGAPSLPDTSGVIAAVTFRVPEDTMAITTRSTVTGAV